MPDKSRPSSGASRAKASRRSTVGDEGTPADVVGGTDAAAPQRRARASGRRTGWTATSRSAPGARRSAASSAAGSPPSSRWPTSWCSTRSSCPGADINGTTLPFPSVAAVDRAGRRRDDDPHGRRRPVPVRAGHRPGHQRDRRRLRGHAAVLAGDHGPDRARGPADHRAGAHRLPAGGLRGHPAAAEDGDRRRHRLLPHDHRAGRRRHHPARASR